MYIDSSHISMFERTSMIGTIFNHKKNLKTNVVSETERDIS